MKKFILMILATLFGMVGCSYVTSAAPTTETVNGDVWYVKTRTVVGLVVGADVFYCPKSTGAGAATCQQATIVDDSGDGAGAQGEFNSGWGEQPGFGAPGQPGMQQPGMQQPGMQQPGMQQPGMQQPGMPGQPGMQQPGMQQPGMQQPGMQQPGMQQQPGMPRQPGAAVPGQPQAPGAPGAAPAGSATYGL